MSRTDASDFPGPFDEGPLPPFGLFEAEQIVLRMGPALNAHAVWLQNLYTLLVCRTPPTAFDLSPDAGQDSELGRWLADEHNEFLRRNSEYPRAAEWHRQVHERARALCRAVAEGRPIGADEFGAFGAALAGLERSLEVLVKELWDLLRYTDPLTGIATRHAMLPRLREEHLRLQRTGSASSICMVDLDRFKEINDTHGHNAGDAVLEAVSAYLVHNLRRYDQVCRYGGEEFVLMLPNTEPEQALPIVDRLRRGISGLEIKLEDGTMLHITASIGVAPLLAHEPIAACIEKADRAMYQAKRAGRDRVQIWREPRSAPASSPPGLD